MAFALTTPRSCVLRVAGGRVARRSVAPCAQDKPDLPSGQEVPKISTPVPVSAPVAERKLLGRIQEAVNGRAAMLGMTAAVASELITHQSVWSQLAGKYVNLQLVEPPVHASSVLYFTVVALVIIASIAPKLIENEDPDSRKFGPFTPGLENTLGRVAMLAFPLLLLTENVVHAAVF